MSIKEILEIISASIDDVHVDNPKDFTALKGCVALVNVLLDAINEQENTEEG